MKTKQVKANDKEVKSSHKAKQNKPRRNDFTEDLSAGALTEMWLAGW